MMAEANSPRKAAEPAGRKAVRFAAFLLLASILSAASCQRRDESPKAAGLRIVAGPYVMFPTKHTVTVCWETNRPSTSRVDFGEMIPFARCAASSTAETIHRITLGGLAEGSDYVYRVSSTVPSQDGEIAQTVAGPIATFKTAPPEWAPFRFCAFGDIQAHPEQFAKIAERIFDERPDFVLAMGDLVGRGTSHDDWLKGLFQPGRRLFLHVPLYACIGNHEEHADWYYRYFPYPPPGDYYSFDWGNAHFVSVDSNPGRYERGTAQYKWLESDLRSTTATWKIVFHHHPPYASDHCAWSDPRGRKRLYGDMNVRRELVPLYDRYGVDLVLSGHIHCYERTYPIRSGKLDAARGVTYVILGTAGAEGDRFHTQRPWFSAKVALKPHYALVGIVGRRLDFRVFDIDGKIVDFFALEKKTTGDRP